MMNDESKSLRMVETKLFLQGGAAQGQEGEEAELGEPRRLRGPRHRALHAQLHPRQAHARRQPRDGPEAEVTCSGERRETRGSDADGEHKPHQVPALLPCQLWCVQTDTAGWWR